MVTHSFNILQIPKISEKMRNRIIVHVSLNYDMIISKYSKPHSAQICIIFYNRKFHYAHKLFFTFINVVCSVRVLNLTSYYDVAVLNLNYNVWTIILYTYSSKYLYFLYGNLVNVYYNEAIFFDTDLNVSYRLTQTYDF